MTDKLEQLKKKMEKAEVAYTACDAARNAARNAALDTAAACDAALDAALDAHAAYYQELNKNKNNE